MFLCVCVSLRRQTTETYFGQLLFLVFILLRGTIAGWVGWFCLPSAERLLQRQAAHLHSHDDETAQTTSAAKKDKHSEHIWFRSRWTQWNDQISNLTKQRHKEFWTHNFYLCYVGRSVPAQGCGCWRGLLFQGARSSAHNPVLSHAGTAKITLTICPTATSQQSRPVWGVFAHLFWRLFASRARFRGGFAATCWLRPPTYLQPRHERMNTWTHPTGLREETAGNPPLLSCCRRLLGRSGRHRRQKRRLYSSWRLTCGCRCSEVSACPAAPCRPARSRLVPSGKATSVSAR